MKSDEQIIKEFNILADKNDDWNCGLSPEEILSFILSLRQSDREAVVKMIEEMRRNGDEMAMANKDIWEEFGWNSALSSLKEKLLNNK